MKFEEKLTTLRKKAGMSQEDLAERLNVSRQAISRWELGSTLPDAPNLLKLSDLFGVSINYLLRDGEEEERSASPENEPSQKAAGKATKRRQFYLVACIAWLIAAVCFLIAAIDRMSIHLVFLVIIDVVLACVFLWKYCKCKE